jgi:transposase-like protein
LAVLSTLDIILTLEIFGGDRHRSTVYRWVQKADLQPTDGAEPNHDAVDETVFQFNTERYWLYAAVDPDTNCLLHVQLYLTRTSVIVLTFLSELLKKYQVGNATFPLGGAPWL